MANTRLGLWRGSPWVDDCNASGMEWCLVTSGHAELTGSRNRGDLGIGNRHQMTMPARACDDLRVSFSAADVERHDPLAGPRISNIS